jgi:hypothetical protein
MSMPGRMVSPRTKPMVSWESARPPLPRGHVEALKHAPETELPITEGGRHILRAMRPPERNR